ncbi:hypothetical protein A4X09_0g6186 [Tilletia walkeri]|uniref:Uncharacterized protein n=1 Tax=Tilletia walkeri TaxID=117179 RepID=A0A8X7N4B0_9BASI|nr:hypothetical protein A4X09_0g6186 [Tilletia walkeri]
MAHSVFFRKHTLRVFVSRPRLSIRRSAMSGLAKISGPKSSHLCEHVRRQQASSSVALLSASTSSLLCLNIGSYFRHRCTNTL